MDTNLNTDNNDYLVESRLKKENEFLHNNARNNITVLDSMLQSYTAVFPDFTDHTILHSMDVLTYCNEIIGKDQIPLLSVDDCYVIMMACYLHDIGMGIKEKDYEEFSEKMDFGDYFETHDKSDPSAVIRAFHNEFSGLYIKKYNDFFEIPSEEHLFAVIQACRGHRKTDLFDEKEFYDVKLPDGGVIHTTYIAALIRLADEVDVASDRNPELLYDTSLLTAERDIIEFGNHESIKRVELTEDAIVLHCKPKGPEYVERIKKIADKIQMTLDYCRKAAAERSSFTIKQNSVRLEME